MQAHALNNDYKSNWNPPAPADPPSGFLEFVCYHVSPHLSIERSRKDSCPTAQSLRIGLSYPARNTPIRTLYSMTVELRRLLEKSATRSMRSAEAHPAQIRAGKVRVALFCTFAENLRIHRMLWLFGSLWCCKLSSCVAL